MQILCKQEFDFAMKALLLHNNNKKCPLKENYEETHQIYCTYPTETGQLLKVTFILFSPVHVLFSLQTSTGGEHINHST